MIWAQFAAYHVDRCEAVAGRLGRRGRLRAIEVATTSADYAWEPSGGVVGADKVTLFPGRSFDRVPWPHRYAAMLRATWRCDVVCIGLSYALPDAVLLSWTLRLLGRRVVVFSESKFDDSHRSAPLELLKLLVLSCYCAAIVGGRRHREYFRFLGFRRRAVLFGYDTVGVERIRRQAAAHDDDTEFAERPFVFVGRFVDKKNLLTLVRGYARYALDAGSRPRSLVLVGSGPEERALRDLVQELGIADLVQFPGFLTAEAVSRTLGRAAALVLVSREEQWGLVVNEAIALGIPVIVSYEVGARDLLIGNLDNGIVVDSGDPDGIGAAMLQMTADEAEWNRMREAAYRRAPLGDCACLAEAVEAVAFPAAPGGPHHAGELARTEIAAP